MKNSNNQRTGIQAGDMVVYYKIGNMIGVFRPSQDGDTQLRTEFDDNKIEVYISNTAFILMLCQLTGLQAVQIQNDEQVTKWMMQEGDSIFSDTETKTVKETEYELIKNALEKHNGRRKKAAEELGISERTLYRKCHEYNLL